MVIATRIACIEKPVLIELHPADDELDWSPGFIGDHVTELYGMVAVPDNVTRPAWVVAQTTQLAELVGHRVHRVHRCREAVSA